MKHRHDIAAGHEDMLANIQRQGGFKDVLLLPVEGPEIQGYDRHGRS